MVKIGIIGGSGVDDPKIMPDAKKIKVHTPYGAASDLATTGTVKGIHVVVIPRHGDSHRINPTNINYRANIWAMKELGVTHIIAPTACGSLREEIKPGDLVFIDQFIDRTTKRHQTFYEGTEVCHIPMAEPFCTKLRKILAETASEMNLEHHLQFLVLPTNGLLHVERSDGIEHLPPRHDPLHFIEELLALQFLLVSNREERCLGRH